jgi:hypothetical protein
MNDANDKRDHKHKLDFKEFYNDAINKDVRLTDHYLVWKAEREKAIKENRRVDRHKYFSLCFYPWILDAATKSDILKQENKSQQRNQLNNNIMDLLFNPGAGGMYLVLQVDRNNLIEDTLKQI